MISLAEEARFASAGVFHPFRFVRMKLANIAMKIVWVPFFFSDSRFFSHGRVFGGSSRAYDIQKLEKKPRTPAYSKGGETSIF